MVEAVANGNTSMLYFSGAKGRNLVSSLMSSVNLSAVIVGNEGITVDVERFSIMENKEDELTLWIKSVIHNPSVLKAKLDLFDITVMYEGKPVGTVEAETDWILPGDNQLEGLMTFKEE